MVRITALCLLLCSSFVLSQNPPQWKVVREKHIIGATSGQAPVTLFTADGNSLYRATEYIAGRSKAVQQAGWRLVISWVDRYDEAEQLACSLVFDPLFRNAGC